jgi:hypothetical protein
VVVVRLCSWSTAFVVEVTIAVHHTHTAEVSRFKHHLIFVLVISRRQAFGRTQGTNEKDPKAIGRTTFMLRLATSKKSTESPKDRFD